MSQGIACSCPESRKPVEERAWEVFARKCNFSAFNGNRYTPSKYSGVRCLACNTIWRTKAAFVEKLGDKGTVKLAPLPEGQMRCGICREVLDCSEIDTEDRCYACCEKISEQNGDS